MGMTDWTEYECNDCGKSEMVYPDEGKTLVKTKGWKIDVDKEILKCPECNKKQIDSRDIVDLD